MLFVDCYIGSLSTTLPSLLFVNCSVPVLISYGLGEAAGLLVGLCSFNVLALVHCLLGYWGFECSGSVPA